MTIAIDFVGTNTGSGTKTYNINFCNELNAALNGLKDPPNHEVAPADRNPLFQTYGHGSPPVPARQQLPL